MEPVPEDKTDKVEVTTTAGSERLDIPWEAIQAAQEADPTLQRNSRTFVETRSSARCQRVRN